ncbi:hypothetical protein M3Y97_00996500 [Aphelenchoides bicaudatus]|nr:hypothetical protein M3Y97_00996500 [Aphelenchoides bicaudatus]
MNDNNVDMTKSSEYEVPSTEKVLSTEADRYARSQLPPLPKISVLPGSGTWGSLSSSARLKLLELQARGGMAEDKSPDDDLSLVYKQTKFPNSTRNSKIVNLEINFSNSRLEEMVLFKPNYYCRQIEMHNRGTERIAFRLIPAQHDCFFRASEQSGFIMPGAKVWSEIKIDMLKNEFNVLYRESVQQYIHHAFNDGTCHIKTIRL